MTESNWKEPKLSPISFPQDINQNLLLPNVNILLQAHRDINPETTFKVVLTVITCNTTAAPKNSYFWAKVLDVTAEEKENTEAP